MCAELLLVAHMFTKHYIGEYNETNPGLAVECRMAEFAVAAGFYKNSYSEQSRYIAGARDFANYGPFTIRGIVGLADGYAQDGYGGILPIAGANIITRLPGPFELGVTLTPFMAHATISIRLS